ncbi:uncharacterized protein LOC141529369 [Cotesia typhae]|uniref:uncharacterized protein LOC141529369 n=1 Tax=Cotesia typhae TaxID=2053667 RepID=UPI003D6878FC
MIILLAGILCFGEAYGNPIMNELKPPEMRDKNWTPVENSWSPSSTSRFLRYDDSDDKNELLLMKERIDNIERSQREIYKLLKKISSNCSSNNCLTKRRTQPQSSLQIKEDDKLMAIISKSLASSTSSSTFTSTLDSVSPVGFASSSVPTTFTPSSTFSLPTSNIDSTVEDAKF